MDKQRELDQEAWTEAELAAAKRDAAKKAKAIEERAAMMRAELLKPPCEICGGSVITSPVEAEQISARVLLRVRCEKCDRDTTRLATRKGLDLWRIKRRVLVVVSPDCNDQIVDLHSVTWAKLTHQPDASMVELTTSGGNWATAIVADGENLLAAIAAVLEETA